MGVLVAACLNCSLWDLVSCPGIESGPPVLGMQSVSLWTTREVPASLFKIDLLGMVTGFLEQLLIVPLLVRPYGTYWWVCRAPLTLTECSA